MRIQTRKRGGRIRGAQFTKWRSVYRSAYRIYRSIGVRACVTVLVCQGELDIMWAFPIL